MSGLLSRCHIACQIMVCSHTLVSALSAASCAALTAAAAASVKTSHFLTQCIFEYHIEWSLLLYP